MRGASRDKQGDGESQRAPADVPDVIQRPAIDGADTDGTGGSGGGGSGGDGGAHGGETRGKGGGNCRLAGRVENWEPPATADLRSSYRWNDERKVSRIDQKNSLQSTSPAF